MQGTPTRRRERRGNVEVWRASLPARDDGCICIVWCVTEGFSRGRLHVIIPTRLPDCTLIRHHMEVTAARVC